MLEKKILNDRSEWLTARTRIGGSDASAIVGMNPYRTNVELWKIKTGRMEADDISEKPYVRYGIEAEPHLRELFRLDHPEYKVSYEENNLFTNDKFPFAHASLDGWITEQETGRTGILEIKATNILQSMQKEKWKDRIPDNYYIQLLHYLMVTEYDFAVLKAQLKYEFNNDIYLLVRHYRIERSDVAEDIKYLEEAERRFWASVQEHRMPALILPEI